jgi:hypothetical protein
MLYGKANKRPDGSYIATDWVVALYLPLWPLASYRMQEVSTETNYVGSSMYSSTSYRILESVRRDWRRIALRYLLVTIPALAFVVACVVHSPQPASP